MSAKPSDLQAAFSVRLTMLLAGSEGGALTGLGLAQTHSNPSHSQAQSVTILPASTTHITADAARLDRAANFLQLVRDRASEAAGSPAAQRQMIQNLLQARP